MFDVWLGGMELTTLTVVVSVVLLLPLQLILCFKVKSRMVRLMPVIVLFVLMVLFVFLNFLVSGWDGLGYLVFAVFAGMMLLLCGLGWGIWVVCNRKKK